MITVDQMTSSHKANLETLFGLTHSAFASFEKLVELNLTATKAALSETVAHAHAAMGVKDVQELLALQAGLFQPIAEKSVSYGRHLYDIASSTSAQFGKAIEEKSEEAQKTFVALIDSAAKNAPAGSETAVSVMKSAVAAGQNAMESVQKAVKQATDMVEANFNAVTTTAVNATKTAAKKR